MKVALISGITGQDGAYLAKFLLDKNYKVYGLIRSVTGTNVYRLQYLGINKQVELMECDLQDLSQVIKIILETKPAEIYNLAAQSSVSLSFKQPIGTIQFNINSVVNILEAIRLINPAIRFYQASSSEMFGRIEELPITENSKLHPLSPYAISKVAAHHITVNYRESYGLYACSGILFNHESYLRGDNFIVKKALTGAFDILSGKREFIEFGNLDVKRDFGFSKKYVEVMWLMQQQEKPDDFVICSGKSVYLRDVVKYIFTKLNIPLSAIRVNEGLFRPTDIVDIYGSSEKAKRLLGWDYKMDFFEVLDMLIEEERLNYGK
ncbi:MAG TPA: GDP-mannose 4,6-dehydratase [Chitinophagaceae bacterium]|jgi:GDPmannose 4,6-dehydratase|nr:GDP-mannose 4,6-dehydratase [Chitinophagaceae bacterium]